MQDYGLVSIIMPNFNCAALIGFSIKTVLAQTYKNWELLIQDDCSTDNPEVLIKHYEDKDPRIKFERNLEFSGAAVSRNNALKRAKGRWIAFLDSDDLWEPDKLEKQVSFLENHPEYAACFTHVKYMDENSENYDLPMGHTYRKIFDVENRTKEEWLHYFFFTGNCLCHPSILIRKEE